jgi:hypothetical protein
MTLMQTEPETSNFTKEQLSRLNAALAPFHAEYNPEQRALRRPFSSPGYHTTLTGGYVHPTRESLEYAVAILDAGEPDLVKRSEDILRRIIAEQDQDPASTTYGIWSWFLDEPLTQMSPPDWNWADFCGVQLLQVAQFHRDQFDVELMTLVDTAIVHAARSIVRRNVGPHYTNIAIMGTYVTLIAAQLYGIADLKEYALARLARFHEHTLRNGGFSEFNSPTYTIVALKELGRLRRDVRLPESRKMIEELYTIAWEEMATHFHVPTRQWGGPHSRWYRTLMDDPTLGLIERGVQRPLGWHKADGAPSLDEHRLPLPCPPKFEASFAEFGKTRQLVKYFQRESPELVGTTFFTPQFTLGSINALDLWNQRRSLLAYWGTAQNSAYLRLKFLHDDYDLCAAQFLSVQNQGDVLAGVQFATDGGDRHPIFDRLKNGELPAGDLRLRFEIGGSFGDTLPEVPADLHGPIHLAFGDVHIELAVPLVKFGDHKPVWKIAREGDLLCIDLILYCGPKKLFQLTQLQSAIGLTVSFSDRPISTAPVELHLVGGEIQLGWKGLQLIVPRNAATQDVLQKKFRELNPVITS